ncbi:hypothetical protein PAHAL_6G176300 [Panicum hallii]|uniref:F-box domain-containing protein n=1 Tax=Panicum hallii TaxID=206008 RepID=A0A2T8IGL0_9POAL|nr:hypothetical protein PAHAL_6G176300 [Panicum hallii]
MAAASPPPLPTSVVPAATPSPSPIPTAVSSADVAAADANPAAARAFVSRLLDSARRALSGARRWAELVDRSALSRPDTLSDTTSRLRKNLAYFRANYAAVVALSLAAALLAHPFSLTALLALLAAWCLLYMLLPADAPPLAAFGRTFSDREVLGGLITSSAFVAFLTSVGLLMFSALALGAAVVCAHGAFRVPEDLFLDEPDQAAGSGNQQDEDDDGGSSAAVLLLPDDMLADVLRRLPPRSLAASRCVRKQWCSIIDARRMLRVDLLPLQLDGFFCNPNHLQDRPSFFAPPSTMRRITTCLDDIYDTLSYDTLGYMSIEDHCNGLLLLGQHMVVNPATRQWATLPAYPSSSSSSFSRVDDQLLLRVDNQLIVYDPMVSPQHYEVFLIPMLHAINHGEDDDDDEETQHLPADYSADEYWPQSPYTTHVFSDYSADQYWPPSPYTTHVFSSRKWRWEERSFVRQGDPAGTIADMMWRDAGGSLDGQGVYFQGALYVRCRNDSVIRINLSGDKYQMIKSPVSRTRLGEYDLSYLGKSEKGVYSALLHQDGVSCPQCRVWLLNELCGQMEWVLKSNINLQSLEDIPHLQFANKYSKPWTTVDDYNTKDEAPAQDQLDGWDSDDGIVLEITDNKQATTTDWSFGNVFLGFHPYKEIAFFDVSSGVGFVSYHLNTSKVQELGTFHITELENVFPYTACWMRDLFENN